MYYLSADGGQLQLKSGSIGLAMRRGVWEMMFSGAVSNIPACSRLSSCITNKFQAFSFDHDLCSNHLYLQVITVWLKTCLWIVVSRAADALSVHTTLSIMGKHGVQHPACRFAVTRCSVVLQLVRTVHRATPMDVLPAGMSGKGKV